MLNCGMEFNFFLISIIMLYQGDHVSVHVSLTEQILLSVNSITLSIHLCCLTQCMYDLEPKLHQPLREQSALDIIPFR